MATVAARSESPEFADRDRVQPLTEGDIEQLRMPWSHRFDQDEMRRMVRAYPGRSVWMPATREYALVGPWRHRAAVASINELAAVQHPEALVLGVIEQARVHGAKLVLATEIDERRHPAFYRRVGLEPLEEVITFELDRASSDRPGKTPLVFEDAIGTDEELEALLEIDHKAFPWLWWNSNQEFQNYLATPGVEVHLGYLDGRPVSYIGITVFPGWGHLDRIAVLPELQGRGLGEATLRYAVTTLARRGARKVGLSTQAANMRSQRLYSRFGFRRSQRHDYLLYGQWLDEIPVEDDDRRG